MGIKRNERGGGGGRGNTTLTLFQFDLEKSYCLKMDVDSKRDSVFGTVEGKDYHKLMTPQVIIACYLNSKMHIKSRKRPLSSSSYAVI